MFVNWTTSQAGFDPGDYYIVQRVNVANNPMNGITVLGGIKILADSVKHAEFVIVISKVARRESPAGHALLRFVFREDRQPTMLDRDGEPIANDARIEDIVLSWEAWRPPHTAWDPVKGLDPKTYALTPRCYLGSVRCLADAILDRPWHCYPLKLPDVDHAADELLYVSLALADAVSRKTVVSVLEEGVEEEEEEHDLSETELREWESILEQYRKAKVPENPIRDILQGKVRYHLLERSCITMALTSVDWANRRIHRRGGLGEPKRIRVAPTAMPAFLEDLAAGKRRAMLLHAPAALHWLMMNQAVLPSKAHELLDEAGLLHHEHGHIKEQHYDNRNHSPYGEITEHIIY
jgi:hypothetical protein